MTDYDPYSFAVREDPYPYYEQLRKTCPVHHHQLGSVAMGGICEMLGIPAGDRPLFKKWTDDTIAAFGGNAESYDQSFSSLMELSQYFMAEIERRKAAAADDRDVPDDVLSALIFSPYEERQFNDVELIMACQILLVAGSDTTTHAIGNAVHLLCTHPEERAKLVADWSLLDNAMEEVLRFEPPVQGLFRTATEGVEVAGCPIPADAKVRVMYASANRDTDFLPDADEFRIDRDPKALRRHLAFGFGIHGCVGSAMGRMELRTAVQTLFRRLPDLDLNPARPPRRLDAFFMRGFESLPVRFTPVPR